MIKPKEYHIKKSKTDIVTCLRCKIKLEKEAAYQSQTIDKRYICFSCLKKYSGNVIFVKIS